MLQPARILIIRTGALGDTIVMSVVYQALRKHFPVAWIEAMGPVERLRLINPPGVIDRLTSSEAAGFSALYGDDVCLSDYQRAYFRQFDTILLYSVDSEKTLQNNLCKICAHSVYVFDPFPPPGENRHITTYLLETLQVLDIHERELVPEIALPNNVSATSAPDERATTHPPPPSLAKRGGRGVSSGWVAVHPGSGSPNKNWPAANFGWICRQLGEQHQVRIALICGPADEFSADVVLSYLPREAAEVIRQPDVLDLAARLRQCRLYLGNDSGVSHLAAATGIPTVVLFGPSNPQVWRPIGPRVQVLQGDGRPYCRGISVAAVWQAVNAMLA